MPTLNEMYSLAVQQHQQGQLAEAERSYREILRQQPRHWGALHLLGVIAHQMGHYDQAVTLIRQAVEIRPDFVEAHSNLGLALKQQGNVDLAMACFREAIRLRPEFLAARLQLGLAQRDQDDLQASLASFEQVLQQEPTHPDGLKNLGIVQSRLGQHDAAIATLQRAIERQPADADSHNQLGIAYIAKKELTLAITSFREAVKIWPDFHSARSNLGKALLEQGHVDESIRCFRAYLIHRPDSVDIHNQLGLALQILGRLDEAAASYQTALDLEPTSAEVLGNLGNTRREQYRLDEAETLLRRALAIDPESSVLRNNLGILLHIEGKYHEAIELYHHALALNPNSAETHCNLGMTLLVLGEFEQGWREYEWRFLGPELELPKFRQPLWDGSPLAGRTIFLHAEQGFGDTMQFIRFAPQVQAIGGRTIVSVDKKLRELLLHSPGIDQILETEILPDFDVHAPLMTLPRILGVNLNNLPDKTPYLFVPPERRSIWKPRLAKIQGFKVGIVWQGNPGHTTDYLRSVSLDAFSPFKEVDGVTFISLQKGKGREQVHNAPFDIIDFSDDLGDFADTAAVVQELDLVITVDTSVAHLTGGLGVPVWIALAAVPDWRWLLERADSPWYPSARLFRQAYGKSWEPVFAEMAIELRKLVAKQGDSPRLFNPSTRDDVSA